MTEEQTCAMCFYSELKDVGQGICRRYPPKGFPMQVRSPVSGMQTQGTLNVWPGVQMSDQGCGEFKAKFEEGPNES